MRASFLLGLALAAGAAEAKPLAVAGKAEVSALVDVPLYTSPGGADPGWYVEAKAGDKALLLRVATGHGEVKLTEAAIARIGAKASGAEGKKTARVAELDLGGVKLREIAAKVVPPSRGPYVHGEIGLGGFPGLAYSIQPSAGTVKLAPAAAGAELVAAVGTAVPFTQSPGGKQKLGGKDYEWDDALYMVPVTFSGVAIPTELVTQSDETWIAREVAGTWFSVAGGDPPPKYDLPAAPSHPAGSATHEWRSVAVAGAERQALVTRSGKGPGYVFDAPARVGMDILAGFDLAIDPAGGRLALRPSPASAAKPYAPVVEAQLRKDLEPPPADPAAKAPADPAAEAKRLAGAQGALAAFLVDRGAYEEGAQLARAAAEALGNDCAPWGVAGGAYLSLGQSAAAAEAFAKGAALYEAWAARPLAERTKISKDKAASDKAKKTWTGPQPQDHGCHVQWGNLGLARVQAGDFAGAAALYPAKLDLDETLPVAAGIALLKLGRPADAEAAFRQAVKLTEGAWPVEARTGLLLAIAGRDPALALAQVDAQGHALSELPRPALEAWASLLAEVRGAAAVGKLKAAAESWPGHAGAQVVIADALRRAGDPAAADLALAQALARAEQEVAAFPAAGQGWIALAEARLAAGKLADAEAALARASALAPHDAHVAWAAAKIAAAKGDSSGAAALRKRAAILGVRSPAYAQHLGS